MPLVHHEQCFGCGRANLFGLLLEVEQTGRDAVAGRCFIKQDHQGARFGFAHEGIIAAALSEAMAFACGPDTRLTSETPRSFARNAGGYQLTPHGDARQPHAPDPEGAPR